MVAEPCEMGLHLKERFVRCVPLAFVLLYPSVGAGCFWREGRGRDVYVERRHVEHEHERREERRDHDRH